MMIIGLLVLANFVTLDLLIRTQQHFIKLTELGGEQRLMFQRVNRVAAHVMAEVEKDQPDRRLLERSQAHLGSLIAKLRANHLALMANTARTSFGLMNTSEINRYFTEKPFQLDHNVGRFLDRTDKLAAFDADTLNQRYRMWGAMDLAAATDGKIVRGLDQVMSEFYALGKSHIGLLRRTHIILTVLTAATMVLVSLLLFRPLVCRLSQEHQNLLRSRAKLDHLAHHDPLTGLGNRAKFNLELEEARDQADAAGSFFTLLLIDLDNFKNINDSLGHKAGDAVLVAVTKLLGSMVRSSDCIARLGGDEFAILLKDTDEKHRIRSFALALNAKLADPIQLGDGQLFVGGSIGSAHYPVDADNLDDLLAYADLAMYRAKSEGRGCHVHFHDELRTTLDCFQKQTDDLRRALGQQEFVLHYQPIVETVSGRPCGFEALIRWQHPERGLLFPGSFLPAAERGGLMIDLTRCVLDRVHADRQQLVAGIANGYVSINLPEAFLAMRDAPELIRSACGGDPGGWLQVELLENVLLHRAHDTILRNLHRFAAMDVSIAMDDFGTGFASLSHLRAFPCHVVKIDRSFVGDLERDPEALAIIRGVSIMAEGLNMKVVAEGVETEAQRHQVAACGCQFAQGFKFTRPIPLEQAVQWTRQALGREGIGLREHPQLAHEVS
ncbi:MAG: putative bifunctional diguanylate cyclase/phosphodiesterase [Geminicoccaceae bacterium]